MWQRIQATGTSLTALVHSGTRPLCVVCVLMPVRFVNNSQASGAAEDLKSARTRRRVQASRPNECQQHGIVPVNQNGPLFSLIATPGVRCPLAWSAPIVDKYLLLWHWLAWYTNVAFSPSGGFPPTN